jgi:hypothetical protein
MRRFVLITFLCMFGIACSSTQLAYRNADWLLERYAGKTVDINATQRAQWRSSLDQTLQLHRSNELPRLVAYLDDVSRIISQPGTGAGCLLDGATMIAERHARLAADLAAPLLADLEAAQVTHLRDYTQQRQRELFERYLDPDLAERAAKRRTRYIKRIEAWTGPLNNEQLQLVEDALGQIPDLAPAWLAHREQQIDRLLLLLESEPDTESLAQFLRSWWVEWDGRSTADMEQWQLAKDAFTDFLNSLGATLTAKQHSRLQQRLGKLRSQLAALLPPDHTPSERMAADGTCTSVLAKLAQPDTP